MASTLPVMGRALAALLLAGGLQGCAAAGLTLMSTGAGVGASAAVQQSLSGIAYKTFTASTGEVHQASLQALSRMDLPVTSDKAEGSNRTIMAKANGRDVEIDIERISRRASRMRVIAEQDVPFLHDQATATEIILQTSQYVEERQFANR